MRIFISLVLLLLSIVSCKNQQIDLKTDFLIGKWTSYNSTTTENGITKTDSLFVAPIYYEFLENGLAKTGLKLMDTLEWKISSKNELSIGLNGKFAKYSTEIKSDSILILSRNYKTKTFSYNFKRGWAEKN